MLVLGKAIARKDGEESKTILYLSDSFPEYYSQSEKGRSCVGQYCESVYVGTYNCDKIDVGANIEILYDRAVTTKNGSVFQPIREIRVMK